MTRPATPPTAPNILLLGSHVSISNLPLKEVSLLTEGSLPAYGYNPGDFIELLAGPVKVEDGRLEQCCTWLSTCLGFSKQTPRLRTVKYGERKKVYQIFRKRNLGSGREEEKGWFMFQQILPPEGRSGEPARVELDGPDQEKFQDNQGIIVVDDSGHPPEIAAALGQRNEQPWVIGMGISTANWQQWAATFRDHFYLCCRLSDLETTRTEMDASVVWESLVAMTIRAIKSTETGLWSEQEQRFRCHILVEMYPHGLLYLGPAGIFFRHRKKKLPQRSSPRHLGSVPCYDTMVTSMLARDFLIQGGPIFSPNYFFDFSQRVLHNWLQIHEQGYGFDGGLKFPSLHFGQDPSQAGACSILEHQPEPHFLGLPTRSRSFDLRLDQAACQHWNQEKKQALRGIFPLKSPYSTTLKQQHGLPGGPLGLVIEVLHYLIEEVCWKRGFDQLRLFSVGHLRTTDPVEIGPVITLQNVMNSYVSRETYQRPLCVGVFGPPGSGKSFSVKEVARIIARKFETNPFEFFEFNLTQFQNPDEINGAIEPVRASVAKGKLPIVFWDEFDCRYDNNEFGYLRYFLPAMQDGVTYEHGAPYTIGRSIFVFAGGVKSSWEEMEQLLGADDPGQARLARTLKLPDFMSRLRVVLDIDGITLDDKLLHHNANQEEMDTLRRILLKRAFIIAHQMDTHWKKAARKTSGLLLRLLLAEYKYGARSIEAVIEASGAADRLVYGLPELIAPPAARIHAHWRVELEREVDLIRKQQGVRSVW
ncbi:ATP-binding protein [Desulfogranum mediterraneum]|uniref:ATP-binding protein n=1 Tax=Desulfogranum mediterraneum TaxID=160661 RepID=UPI0004074D52|nr:ATP-binding protein [Desulfogranum mediterraneum]